MYQKLLISAGGGIISRSHQSEQDNVATIAIGLGGTGIDCLRLLKREVYDKLIPDNGEDSVVPEYRHIKYLAVDTDKESLGVTTELDSIDEDTEFFDISSNKIHDLMQKIIKLDNKPEFYWLRNDIKIQNAERGAGGVRQAGRLLLIQKSKEFVERLEALITDAKTGLPEGFSVNVHIFTGMGGGTGAGTFLDVCYLVNHVIESQGLYDHTQICGYFFLPDVNLSKVSNIKTRENIKITGFASMKELDYCMNFQTNHDKWSQQYDGFKYETQLPPVKLAHLITATKSNDQLDEDAYDYAMHATVDFVFEYLTKPYVDKDNKSFSMASHISNVDGEKINVKREHGACFEYCVIGASMKYLPFKDITTYLSSKIFESFQGIPTKYPTESDMDSFLKDNKLDYESIKREIQNRVPSITAIDYYSDLYDDCINLPSDRIPKTFIKMRDNTFAKVDGQLSTNKNALTKPIITISDNDSNDTVSLLEKTKSVLSVISCDPNKGPFFAANLLHSQKIKDYQSVLTGYIEEANKQEALDNGDLTLRWEDYAKALKEFQKSNFANRKSKGKQYIQSVYNVYNQQRKVAIDNTVIDVLTIFKEQIEGLYNSFYIKLITVFDELIKTFEANLQYLSEPIKTKNTYAKPIITVADLKKNLDKTVADMKLNQLFSYFVSEMLNNPDEWISYQENNICHLVSRFFLKELNNYTNKTLVDYLRYKYDVSTTQELVDSITKDIINPIYSDSTPLFWTSGEFNISDSSKVGFISVPNISPEIQAAANKIKNKDSQMEVRIDGSTDKVSAFQFLCGVPMFGYMGAIQFWNDYKNGYSRHVGCHIYEGSLHEERNSIELVNICPQSSLYGMERTDGNKKAIYEKASEKGLFDLDETKKTFKLILLDENKVNEAITKIEEIISTNNIVKMIALRDNLPNVFSFAKGDMIILNDGAENHEADVRMDHATSSLVIMKNISEQLEILEKYEAVVAKLEESIVDGDPKVFKKFIDAMCCNVIFKESTFRYKYKTDSGIFADEIELTTRETKPYGAEMPLYSAYYGYKNLSDEIKADIDKAVDNIMDNDESYETIYLANKQRIKELILTQGKQDLDNASKVFQAEYNEIKSVMESLAKVL